VAVVVFIFDRVTKALVTANLPLGTEVPAIDHLVWIAHTQNSCAAFGQGCTLAFLYVPLYAAVAIGLAVYVLRTSGSIWTDLLLGLILGGTLGNGYDRVVQGGSVTDFVALHWFPVFNVADSAISVAVVVLLAGYLLRRENSV
jgi:signal peptidase II